MYNSIERLPMSGGGQCQGLKGEVIKGHEETFGDDACVNHLDGFIGIYMCQNLTNNTL